MNYKIILHWYKNCTEKFLFDKKQMQDDYFKISFFGFNDFYYIYRLLNHANIPYRKNEYWNTMDPIIHIIKIILGYSFLIVRRKIAKSYIKMYYVCSMHIF